MYFGETKEEWGRARARWWGGGVREFAGAIVQECLLYNETASSVVYPSCQQTHHITSSGCKPYYYAFQANHTTIVMPSRSIHPNPSFESILCILKSWTRGFSCNRLSIKVRRISPHARSNHSAVKATFYTAFLYFDIR